MPIATPEVHAEMLACAEASMTERIVEACNDLLCDGGSLR